MVADLPQAVSLRHGRQRLTQSVSSGGLAGHHSAGFMAIGTALIQQVSLRVTCLMPGSSKGTSFTRRRF
jgi:hypothetical protein